MFHASRDAFRTRDGRAGRPGHSWFGPLARVDTPLTHLSHYYAGGFRFYLPGRTTLETTVVENFGAIENRNSSDVSFHFALGWRFGNENPSRKRSRRRAGQRFAGIRVVGIG